MLGDAGHALGMAGVAGALGLQHGGVLEHARLARAEADAREQELEQVVVLLLAFALAFAALAFLLGRFEFLGPVAEALAPGVQVAHRVHGDVRVDQAAHAVQLGGGVDLLHLRGDLAVVRALGAVEEPAHLRDDLLRLGPHAGLVGGEGGVDLAIAVRQLARQQADDLADHLAQLVAQALLGLGQFLQAL